MVMKKDEALAGRPAVRVKPSPPPMRHEIKGVPGWLFWGCVGVIAAMGVGLAIYG